MCGDVNVGCGVAFRLLCSAFVVPGLLCALSVLT